ncbi:MAG: hypothetical protein HDR53_06380 [Treponema sp.]|nr:hypothetical protein [Treponema sp.]
MKKVLTCILMFFMLCCLSAQNRVKRDWQDVAHDIFALHSEGKATDAEVMALGVTPLEANLVIYYLALIKATEELNSQMEHNVYPSTYQEVEAYCYKVEQVGVCLREFTPNEIADPVFYRSFFFEVADYAKRCNTLTEMLLLYVDMQQ